MTEPLHCYKHPERETYLRCNKCNRPICTECAVQTPTGYRCKECVKEQQKIFDTAETKDYIIGGVIALVLGWVSGFVYQVFPLLPSYISAVIVSLLFGQLIATAVRAACQKRRSGLLINVVMGAAGVGALIELWQNLVVNFNLISLGMGTSGVLQIVIDILFIVMLCGSIFSNLSGMLFRK